MKRAEHVYPRDTKLPGIAMYVTDCSESVLNASFGESASWNRESATVHNDRRQTAQFLIADLHLTFCFPFFLSSPFLIV